MKKIDKGWMIYDKKDVKKNRSYIRMYEQKFALRGIGIETVTLEQFDGRVAKDLPDFAVNRSRDEKAAKTLEQKGVRVYNSFKVTKTANNKAETYRIFEGKVPILTTIYKGRIIGEKSEKRDIPYPRVVKSCGGHGGSEVYLAKDREEEEKAYRKLNKKDYIIQQYEESHCDIRAYVIGGKIIAAVKRSAVYGFKSNYSLGGKAKLCKLSDEEGAIVSTIVEMLHPDFVGIDIMVCNGKPVLNEIEDAAGSRMLYEVSNIDIVEIFVKYIIEDLRGTR